MNDTKLKPCPFCGGTNLFVGTIADVEMQSEDHEDYEYNSEHYVVVCDYTEGGCGASTGGGACCEEEAIEVWNRRTHEPAPKKATPKAQKKKENTSDEKEGI